MANDKSQLLRRLSLYFECEYSSDVVVEIIEITQNIDNG